MTSNDGGRLMRASIAQERRYLVDQASERPPNRLVHAFYSIHGPLSTGALQEALQNSIDRHDALRTSFTLEGGAVWQRVHKGTQISLKAVGGPPDAADTVIRDHLKTRIDRSAEFPLRVTLAQINPTHHILALSMEHMNADGWSLRLILGELSESYEAVIGSRTPNLLPVKVQFPQWADMQRERLTGTRLRQLLERWSARLGLRFDVVEMLLPGARAVEAPRFSGKRTTEVLPPDVLAGLGELAKQERTTLYVVALAAVYTYLARVTGRPDPIVFSSFANRSRAETNRTVGWMSHTILFRASIDASASVRETVQSTRSAVLDSIADGEIPLDVLRRDLWPETYLQMTNIPVVFFEVIQDWGDLSLIDADVRQLDYFEGVAMPGVEIRVGNHPDGLLVDFVHETTTYDDEDARTIFGEICQLLQEYALEGLRGRVTSLTGQGFGVSSDLTGQLGSRALT